MQADGLVEPFALVAPSVREHLPDGLDDAYPVTALQAAMLLRRSLRPTAGAQYVVRTFRLVAPWDETAVMATARALARRHPVLRTTFDLHRYGAPLQLVHCTAEPSVTVVDLRPGSERGQARAYERFLQRERAAGFDWSEAPPYRVFAHRIADDVFDLTLSAHHALLDGWSADLYAREFDDCYRAHSTGADVVDEPLRTSYARFVELERSSAWSATTQQYWKEYLAESASCLLVGTGSRTGRGGRATGHLRRRVDAVVLDGLRELARLWERPASALFLSVHAAVVASVLEVDTVVIGAVTYGRPEEPDGERLLGLFPNILPLQARVGGATWHELVEALDGVDRSAFPHRRHPLADVVHGREGHLFDWACDCRRLDVADGLLTRRVPTGSSTGPAATDLALFVELDIDRSTAALQVTYETAAVGRQRAEAIADRYALALAALVDDPTRPVPAAFDAAAGKAGAR